MKKGKKSTIALRNDIISSIIEILLVLIPLGDIPLVYKILIKVVLFAISYINLNPKRQEMVFMFYKRNRIAISFGLLFFSIFPSIFAGIESSWGNIVTIATKHYIILNLLNNLLTAIIVIFAFNIAVNLSSTYFKKECPSTMNIPSLLSLLIVMCYHYMEIIHIPTDHSISFRYYNQIANISFIFVVLDTIFRAIIHYNWHLKHSFRENKALPHEKKFFMTTGLAKVFFWFCLSSNQPFVRTGFFIIIPIIHFININTLILTKKKSININLSIVSEIIQYLSYCVIVFLQLSG